MLDANEQLKAAQVAGSKHPQQQEHLQQQQEEIKKYMHSIEEAKNKLDSEKAAFEEQRYEQMMFNFYCKY